MVPKHCINIQSEIGSLKEVIIHTPGPEIENMTPQNAGRALYSDILNLSVAGEEYNQFRQVLQTITHTLEVQQLLTDILQQKFIKEQLITKICCDENAESEIEHLLVLNPTELSRQLIEGVILTRENLTNFLSEERFILRPLNNFFFTRDASISIFNEVLIGKMANQIRERESSIMEAIFQNHSLFKGTTTYNQHQSAEKSDLIATIEGGDILIVRKDVLIIGNGCRTNTQGIDFLINSIKTQNQGIKHIFIKELPESPESFIHLDMVFSFLDRDSCMVFGPLMLHNNRFRTIHIILEDKKVASISDEDNLFKALLRLGIDLKPICCGGNADPWIQEREQWHSGANLFAFAPGKVIGYERNIHTLDEMDKNGYEIIKAQDVINHIKNPYDYKKCIITIAGAELARGGGGARCMTMPILRDNIEW